MIEVIATEYERPLIWKFERAFSLTGSAGVGALIVTGLSRRGTALCGDARRNVGPSWRRPAVCGRRPDKWIESQPGLVGTRQDWPFADPGLADLTPVIIFLVFAILAHIVLRYTRYGRQVYAVGGNPEAARLSPG